MDPNGEPIGEERNRRCSIAVVSDAGTHSSIQIPPISMQSIYGSKLSWLDPQNLSMKAPDREYLLPVPQK
jgi:hypothetical protein